MAKRLIFLFSALFAALLPTASAVAEVNVDPQVDGNVKDLNVVVLGIPLSM